MKDYLYLTHACADDREGDYHSIQNHSGTFLQIEHDKNCLQCLN
jgi:hypothetical protein